MLRQTIFIVCFMLALAVNAQTITVNATKYHPGMGGAGWVTASGDRIDNAKLKRYEIRWVALSPDLFRSGFSLGDTIEVTCDRVPRLNGKWVEDKMGASMRKKIDFLLPRGDDHAFTSPTQVTIKKVGKEE